VDLRADAVPSTPPPEKVLGTVHPTQQLPGSHRIVAISTVPTPLAALPIPQP